MSTFPPERFVNFCTKRLRGNAKYVAPGAMRIQADALPAADADVDVGAGPGVMVPQAAG